MRLATVLTAAVLALCISPDAFCQQFLEPIQQSDTSFLSAPSSLNAPSSNNANGAVRVSEMNTQSGPPAPPVRRGFSGAKRLQYEQQASKPIAPGLDTAGNVQVPATTVPYYGLPGGPVLEIYPGPNQYGNYGGSALPPVSTVSIDLNTVDCPFIGAQRPSNGWVYIPGRTIKGIPMPWVNLQETPSAATHFQY